MRCSSKEVGARKSKDSDPLAFTAVAEYHGTAREVSGLLAVFAFVVQRLSVASGAARGQARTASELRLAHNYFADTNDVVRSSLKLSSLRRLASIRRTRSRWSLPSHACKCAPQRSSR